MSSSAAPPPRAYSAPRIRPTCSTTGASPCISGANTSSGIGVIGTSKTGTGLRGTSTSQFGLKSTSTSGIAILAQTTSGSAAISASNAAAGDGVFGSTTATNGGIGVFGQAVNGYGVYGSTTTGAGIGIIGYETGSGTGDIVYRGGLFHVAAITGGALVKSFTANSTLPTVEDTGTAQLVGGVAAFRLDPTFAASIDMTSVYRVFVTPNGDTHGLFVATKTPSGFVVHEAQGGRSTVTCDYRIVATAAGQANVRMAVVNPAARAAVPAAVAPAVAPASAAVPLVKPAVAPPAQPDSP